MSGSPPRPMLLLLLLLLAAAAAAVVPCPVREDTVIVYSRAKGVGGASIIWVEDLLWWLQQADAELKYQGLSETDVQACDLASFSKLRLYINPGGNAYNQLSALQANGTRNIKEFVTRDQAAHPSAFVGFCAGAYMASFAYVWETMFEGLGYFNFKQDPPLDIFPHMVEGSLVDINDDQFSDQMGHKYRMVNVSNGHQMLYFGGSSFGWNAVPDFTDPASPNYDSATEVLLYFSDFYGSAALSGGTYNLPAAWKRENVLMTSIHPCADNCTADHENPESADCPPAGTLPEAMILKNRAWLVQHLNTVSGLSIKLPVATPTPNMSAAKPHSSWPTPLCGKDLLFCDGFDSAPGEVPAGLWQWQRNQSFYNAPQPWNTTYIEEWAGCARPCTTGSHAGNRPIRYGAPADGNGYAVCVPRQNGWNDVHLSAILSKPVAVGGKGATLSYSVRGCTNCTDPIPGGSGSPRIVRSETPACQAALAKQCSGLAHRGPDCHACAMEHAGVLTKAGCNMTGSPPADVMAYCLPGGGGGGAGLPKHPAGAFIVEWRNVPSLEASRRLTRRAEEAPEEWTTLVSRPLKGGASEPWQRESHALPAGNLQVRFSCAGATADGSNYCAVDTVEIESLNEDT